jgi:hypothetical protein
MPSTPVEPCMRRTTHDHTTTPGIEPRGGWLGADAGAVEPQVLLTLPT